MAATVIVSLRLFGSTMRIIFGFIVLLSFGSPDRIVSATKTPNIVFILTDDQDLEIGGMTPMVKAKTLIGDAGISFKNTFVTSPLCCPSRSSILTGNYVHNNGAVNNSLSGNCSSRAWQETSEKNTFVTHLKQQGYQTFYAGKYLNMYGYGSVGGVEHIPPGWDEWHGLVGNSVYYNYTLSVNGKAEVHGDKYPDDYLTDVIARRAEDFILSKQSKESHQKPFFMMLSTPACHAPFTPADQYKKSFEDIKAPRNGSFNQYSPNRHWLLRQAKHPLGEESIKVIDSVYRDRWRTLLSVDDMVEKIISDLEKINALNDTYVVFSSDNGYHLGQLSMPYDKRQMYEFDVRVPLMIRGPGIKPGQVRLETILNIDFAPTFLDLSGQSPSPKMDGESFKKLLFSDSSPVAWRQDFLIEHEGEVQDVIADCPALNHQDVSNCYPDCVCEDALNNTFGCIRVLSNKTNIVYCEFSDSENYVEVYDLNKDPYQLENIVKQLDPKVHLELNQRLMKLSICSGASCRIVHPYS